MEKWFARRIACICLASMVLLGSFLFIPTSMVSAAQDGDYTYELTGNPAVANITRYTGGGGAITIPSTLGGFPTGLINDDAFSWCTSLTSVAVPNTVTSLGYASFYHCTSLTSVTLGGGVTTIASTTFYACSSLRSITFTGLVAPSSVANDWILYTPADIRGHAHAASNFPAPGGSFHGLLMGDSIPPDPTAPGAPTGLTAIGGPGFVRLNWIEPKDSGNPRLTRYDLYRGTSSGTYVGPIGSVPDGALSYSDTAAEPGISYFYIVRAVNSVGASLPSNQARGVATLLLSEPGIPLDFAASAGAGYVRLTWEVPATTGGSSITNYKVYRGESSGGEVLLITLDGILEYIDDAVADGQTYWYQVSAVNGVGEGNRSGKVSSTPGAVPSVPRGLQAIAGDSVVDLSWNEPEYLGPGVIVYHLFRDRSPISSGTARAYRDVSVTKGNTYSYQVAASNSFGWGANSTLVRATPFGTPSEPVGLRASAGDGFVDLDWDAPLYVGPGTLIYHLFRGEAEVYDGVASEYRDGPLLKGVLHSYIVMASNPAGTGPASSTVQSEALGAPDAPRGLSAIAGDDWVELNWTSPAYTGPGTLTYHLFRNGSEIWSGAAEGHLDLFVVNGVVYSYNVAASNSIGWGPNGTEVQATPQAGDTVPSRPLGLTATPGDQSVTLNWTAPSYVGPGPITYYLFRDGAEIWRGAETTYYDSPLTKGMQHLYEVAAQNSLGWGSNCSAVVAIPFGVPDAPWNLVALSGDGQNSLSWNSVNYSGPGTLVYHLFRNGALIWSGSGTDYADAIVINGMIYVYEVSVSNSVGWGMNSSSVHAEPVGPPSQPTGLTAIAGNDYIDLTWGTPEYLGPGNVTYHVFRDGIQIWAGDGLSYNDTSLINGIVYAFWVSASNLLGWGLNCSAIVASPSGPPTVPLSLVATPGIGNVTLNWTTPTYVGDGELLYYIYRDSNASPAWNGPGLVWMDEGLVKGHSYQYKVVARNAVGWGPNSTVVSGTPIGVPSIPFGLEAIVGSRNLTLNWIAPEYAGPGIVTFHLFRDGALIWSGSIANYQDVGVVNGQTYEYKVAAQNDVGWGANSTRLQAMPLGVPEAPLNMRMKIGTGFINLTWSQPSDDGGSPILVYKVFRNPASNPAVPWIINGSTGETWYNDTTVLAGTSYDYFVLASNQIGEGAVITVAASTPPMPTSTSINWIPFAGTTIALVAVTGVGLLIMRKRK